MLGVDAATSAGLISPNSRKFFAVKSTPVKVAELGRRRFVHMSAISTNHTLETVRNVLLSRYRFMQYDGERDGNDVNEFIRQNWDPQHPLSLHHDLFAWQYKVGFTESEPEFLVVRSDFISYMWCPGCAQFSVLPLNDSKVRQKP